jgi:hypothetical protein
MSRSQVFVFPGNNYLCLSGGTVIVCRGALDVLGYLTVSQPEKLPRLLAVSRVGVVVTF